MNKNNQSFNVSVQKVYLCLLHLKPNENKTPEMHYTGQAITRSTGQRPSEITLENILIGNGP